MTRLMVYLFLAVVCFGFSGCDSTECPECPPVDCPPEPGKSPPPDNGAEPTPAVDPDTDPTQVEVIIRPEGV